MSKSAPDEWLDLTPIKAREAKATEGPWVRWLLKVYSGEKRYFNICDLASTCGKYEIEEDNAEFIAHARQDIPVLVRALETAWAEIASLRAALVAPSPQDVLEEIATLRDELEGMPGAQYVAGALYALDNLRDRLAAAPLSLPETPTELEMAERIARGAHTGQKDTVTGADYITHVERVVAMVEGDEAKAVAWLHDVLEDSETTSADLVRAEISDDVRLAVERLTRGYEPYTEYISTIRVCGPELARVVKLADLRDHLQPNCPARLRPRYEAALKELTPVALPVVQDESPKAQLCNWTLESDGEYYDTECGFAFQTLDGSPLSEGLRFCAYCGKSIHVGPFKAVSPSVPFASPKEGKR